MAMSIRVLGGFLVLGLLGACGSGGADETVRLGNKAFEAADVQQALEHYNQALETDARHAGAYLGRGKVYWITNQHEQALHDLDQAIALQPDRTEAYHYRGLSRIMLRRFEDGIADLDIATATEVLPAETRGRAYRFWGIALMNLERYEEAIGVYSKGIGIQPAWPLLYLDRAQLYEAVGEFESAIADYDTYITFGEEGNPQMEATQNKVVALRDSIRQETP